MKRVLLGLFFALLTFSQASADELTRSVALGKSTNFSPIGYVDVIHNNDDGFAEGTATHIGNGLLITAAHTLVDLFPQNVPKSGPVIIDVSLREVYWSNNQSSFDIEQAKKYRAKKIVVDARFIKNYKQGELTPEAIDHDVAIIQLEEAPTTGSIPLALDVKTLPDFGVLVGYGNLSFSLKHAFVQTIGLRAPLNQSREIISDVDRYDIIDYVGYKPSRRESCDVIYGRQCQAYDVFSFDASPGDSGGPLLVNVGGKPQIIGILSYGSKEQIPADEFAYDDPTTPQNETKEFANSGTYFLGSPRSLDDPIVTASINGYVSVISGRPGHFELNKDIEALIKTISSYR